MRIYVNDKKKGAGVPTGGVVRVNIPKDQPCPKGGFYDAARILIFVADVKQFEALLADGAQRGNELKVSWAKDICANDNDADPACRVALAGGAYLPDAPAQLLEYAIISQVGNAQSTKDQNDPNLPGFRGGGYQFTPSASLYLGYSFREQRPPPGRSSQSEHQHDPEHVVDRRPEPDSARPGPAIVLLQQFELLGSRRQPGFGHPVLG